ncbi:hypothetical protein MPSI1_001137 [Malassezia psittaci]|uniref:t-SNARE coiled-coil homology domain-containing protein n=1 Tax=Malassezia psittaci TaxID=1821823 RepID=A0AAF0JD15_9BASI|nr:hypothetical protein MPSI1_001137 [Malassezia psittaci]
MASEARQGLASCTGKEASVRFQSLCAATFSALQERVRLAHEIALSSEASEHAFLRTFPYFARDKTIAKNFHTMLSALNAWSIKHSNGDLLQDDDIPQESQIAEWSSTVHRLVNLLSETNNELNDPRGMEIVSQLRADSSDKVVEHTEYVDSDTLEASNDTTAKALSREDLFSQVERLDSNPSNSHDVSDERMAAQQLAHQASAFRDQDTQLENLSTSISRQHHLSLRMNEELELHTDLLHDLDRGVDNTELRLGGASDRLERFRRAMAEQGM